MTVLAEVAIRSSVVLAAGLVLAACLTRRSAALRHRVLAATLLASACVVPLGFVLPSWSVTLPAAVGHAMAVAPAPPPGAPGVTPAAAAAGAHDSGATDRAARAAAALVIVWLAGALVAAGLLIAGLLRVARTARGAAPVEDARWLAMRDAVARRYGLSRAVALVRTDSESLLATWGIRRPQVLLPSHARDWPPNRVHVVLCHELAHIRRHDWLVQVGSEAVRALFWFNPLAWRACTRLRRESEQACDDEVLGAGVEAREYASHLVALARQCRRPGSTWASALPMAHPTALERRIAAMLNPHLDRRPPSHRALAALAALLLLVTVPAAVLAARQGGPAPLSGTIYDVTGAVLPGVEVVLADANGVTSVVTSDAGGRFEFPPVPPGAYRLEATLAGFRSLRQEIELRRAPDWQRAITLQVGDLMETIRVQASRMADAPSAAASAPQAPVRVGGNVRAPRKVGHVRPDYPASMRAAGLTGTVPIEAIIGRDGRVSSVRVLSAQVHPDFAVAAVDAVRQWRFTPTLLNGEAVEVVMTVSVAFDLE